MNTHLRPAIALLLCGLAACKEPAQRTDTPTAAPAAVANADSQYSTAAMANAYRQKIGGTAPTTLGGGATTDRDSLIAHYARALATTDTAAFRAMQLDVAEFAWLYYTDSPMAQKPYELDPDVMWMQISSQSQRGLVRALNRFGGHAIGATRSACEAPKTAGALRLYACTLTWRPAGASEDFVMPLSIVERDGRFKFVGYGNGL